MNQIPMNDATIRVSHHLPLISSALQAVIDQIAGEPMGFFLMVYTQGRGQHISNRSRDVCIAEISKLLTVWAGTEPRTPVMDETYFRLALQMPRLVRELDELLSETAGEPVAFSLLVFRKGGPGYGGTCARADAHRELQALIDHWRSGEPDLPAHQFAEVANGAGH